MSTVSTEPEIHKPLQPRIKYVRVAPEGIHALQGLETYVRNCGLEPELLELVKLRASQINGCAYCIDMHTKDARTRGESEQRLYELSVWEETPFYSDRERAALAWTETITLIANSHVPDSVYELARQHFSEKELVDLDLMADGAHRFGRLQG